MDSGGRNPLGKTTPTKKKAGSFKKKKEVRVLKRAWGENSVKATVWVTVKGGFPFIVLCD